MNPQDMGPAQGRTGAIEVSESQANNLDRVACHSVKFSAMIAQGRTQAALTSEWGKVGSLSASAPQENWSRGCRIACVSFWPWPWLVSSPLARKKLNKKSSMSTSRRLPSSRPTPANTSNISGRGRGAFAHGPASAARRPAPQCLAPFPENPLHLISAITGGVTC